MRSQLLDKEHSEADVFSPDGTKLGNIKSLAKASGVKQGDHPFYMDKWVEPRRFALLIRESLTGHHMKDLFVAERRILQTAAECNETRLFMRCMTVWLMVMYAMGLTRYSIPVVEEMVKMGERGAVRYNFEEYCALRKAVLRQASLCRELAQPYITPAFTVSLWENEVPA